MSATTSFHADHAALEIREERQHLIALQLLPEHRLTPLINTMNLKDLLCQIDAYCRNLYFGRSSHSVGYCYRHFGTLMPFQGGATIPLAPVQPIDRQRLFQPSTTVSFMRLPCRVQPEPTHKLTNQALGTSISPSPTPLKKSGLSKHSSLPSRKIACCKINT